MSTSTFANASPVHVNRLRAGTELFLISLLILFLELACIRWFGAHVPFLTFFTNTVLLACFLGMSVGCLAAHQRRNYLSWTPVLLLSGMLAAHATYYLQAREELGLDVGHQDAPQMVFFGAEHGTRDLARFIIPVEVVGAFFFLLIALALIGPGQELGRALNRLPNRVQAYTLNILGSIAGIVLFAVCSWWQLTPLWWFLPIGLGLGYFLLRLPRSVLPRVGLALSCAALVAVLGLADVRSGTHTRQTRSITQYLTESLRHEVSPFRPPGPDREGVMRCLWSPYYRIEYEPDRRAIQVNQLHHQHMAPLSKPSLAYALPHLLNRDAGGTAFADVLIIGAGSGNDVSRALQWGAKHVDAVEIDPAILHLGADDHPEHPYQDARVIPHLDDGRNFLRSTDGKYDLVVYALVDSLVLHSSYSNIRLESYLFTRQAFEDVHRCLKPGGLFVMYNYFRQGWLVARLHKGLEEVFGAGNPLIYTLPYQETVKPEEGAQGFTCFLAGSTQRLRQAFQKRPEYWLRSDQPPGPDSPDGFTHPAAAERARWRQLSGEQKAKEPWQRFGLAGVGQPEEPLRTASDDWPFLYLRRPMIPDLSLRGMAIMGGLALLLILLFLPRRQSGASRWAFDGRMFFLGAGFMLIETKAVVHMALLFGSTWMVNSVVFLAVLVMILAANLFVLLRRPERLGLFYAGLLLTLALNALIPLGFFLGQSRGLQVAGSCLLVFAPVWFAGVIFAVTFGRSGEPDRAFGANIAGAMLGGLAENSSMLLGFQYLVLLAVAFYALSAIRFQPQEKLTAAVKT